MAKGKKGPETKAPQAVDTAPDTIWEDKFTAMSQPVPEEFLKPIPRSFLTDNATPEVKLRSEQIKEKLRNPNPFIKFLLKAEERAEDENAAAIERGRIPTNSEDAPFWKKLPLVPGPYGGMPMPRKSISTPEEVDSKFFDFFRQFQFGLWGYRAKPYPAVKPMDIQQVLGFKWLDWRYYDFAMRSGNWYYKDRLGRTRGPCELVNLKTAWGTGIIDRNTFIWGDDMDEWAPIGMVYGLELAIATPDVRLAALGTSIIHKIGRGIAPWAPVKGLEKKSLQQLQKEALEKREYENGVLRRNNGVWPGEKIPLHAAFMWASGTELTSMLGDDVEDDDPLPNRYISYEVRKKLAEEIPGLRPWEVKDLDAVLEHVTLGNEWYREPLGAYSMELEFEEEAEREMDELLDRTQDEVEEIVENFVKADMLSEKTEEKKDKRREQRGKGSKNKPAK